MRLARLVLLQSLFLLFSATGLFAHPAYPSADPVAAASETALRSASFGQRVPLPHFTEPPSPGLIANLPGTAQPHSPSRDVAVLKSHSSQDPEPWRGNANIAMDKNASGRMAVVTCGWQQRLFELGGGAGSPKKKSLFGFFVPQFEADEQPRRPADRLIRVALLSPKTKLYETFPFMPRSPCLSFQG